MGTINSLGGDEEEFCIGEKVHLWPLSSMDRRAERFEHSAPREMDTCNDDHQASDIIQVMGRGRIGQNLVS